MSKMTNAMAENIARLEANKKYDKLITDAEMAFKKTITKAVQKKYPVSAQVKKMVESDDSDFIRMEINVSIKTDNDRYYTSTFNMTDAQPIKRHGSFSLEYDGEIKKTHSEWKKLKEDKQAFFRKIELALKGMKTIKRVVDHFPEFKVHLEDKVTPVYALVPAQTIKEIRKEIVRP